MRARAIGESERGKGCPFPHSFDLLIGGYALEDWVYIAIGEREDGWDSGFDFIEGDLSGGMSVEREGGVLCGVWSAFALLEEGK